MAVGYAVAGDPAVEPAPPIGSSPVAVRWMQAAGIDAFGGEVHMLELAAPGVGCVKSVQAA
jgi:hypothetical protein